MDVCNYYIEREEENAEFRELLGLQQVNLVIKKGRSKPLAVYRAGHRASVDHMLALAFEKVVHRLQIRGNLFTQVHLENSC